MFVPDAAFVSTDDRTRVPIGESPSARRRLTGFLALEHPTVPRFAGIASEEDSRAALYLRREGTPLAVVRQSRETAAALFLQAASAAVFLGARGYPLELSDFDGALVEIWSGAPHLWLARPPRSVSVEPLREDGTSALLAALVPLFFGKPSRGSLRIEAGARKLLDGYLEPFSRPGRPDSALVEIARAFPFLLAPPFASVRRRCVGYRPRGFDAAERRHRAAVDAAELELEGRRPRVFPPGTSTLLPYEALRSSLGLSSAERERESVARKLEACAESDTDWIRVDRESWDEPSLRLFDEVASRRGIEAMDRDASLAAVRPDEIRDAFWIATPDLAASVALYEALAAVAARNARRLRATVSRFVASPEYGSFLSRGALPDSILEGDADAAGRELRALSGDERRAIGVFLAHPAAPGEDELVRLDAADSFRAAAGKLGAEWLVEDPGGRRWRCADPTARADLLSAYADEERRAFAAAWLDSIEDPLGRLVLAIESGRAEELPACVAPLFGEKPGESRPRLYDPLLRAAAAAFGDAAPAPLRYYEADLRAEIGLLADARDRWEALAQDPAIPDSWRRRSALRAASVREGEGDARGAAEHLHRIVSEAASLPDETSAALRALARMAAGEGRFDEADGYLSRAEENGAVSDSERVEVILARAAYHGLRGDGDRERAVYDAHRESIRRSPENTQYRFVLGEGTALSAARDHRGAALRFAEALAASREPAERGAALIDLAVETYLLGDAGGAERGLREAAGVLRGCGQIGLARTAIANLIQLLLETGRDGEAAPLIHRLIAESDRIGDRKGRMLALAFRSRIAFRSGQWGEAGADRREALGLCDALGETIERQELEIDESDARLFSGDAQGALEYARRAAGRQDLAGQRESAALRAADVERWRSGGEPTDDDFEAHFARSPVEAAERVARARAFFGAAFEANRPNWTARAREELRRAGREGVAAAVFSAGGAGDLRGLRSLRDRLAADELPLRVVAEDGAVVWRSPGFERAAWSRPLSWSGAPLTLEGSGPHPDLTAFLFETTRDRAAAPPGPSGDAGLAVLRASGIITAHPAMEAVGSRLARIAAQNVTVFVSGESGTGKEKIARAVHRLSPRCEGPFLAINVAAFPEALLEDELFGHVRGAFTGADRDRAGLFEAAHGGTIFLDEIGDLPLSLQAKLLRVLQEREIKRVGENRFRAVDVRLVSATARSLERAVEDGVFREDLYYRIKVATLALPPLRDRGADVALLARHFLDRSAAEYGKGSLKLTSAASSALRACRWPGNVRQLENTIREAVALADAGATLDREDFSGLPAARDDAKGSYRERVDAFRRRTVEEALARSAGNRTHAAKDLGLTRQALLYLIRELGVRG
jgi:transcriptional regulator with AAA-type ATPase domain